MGVHGWQQGQLFVSRPSDWVCLLLNCTLKWPWEFEKYNTLCSEAAEKNSQFYCESTSTWLKCNNAFNHCSCLAK